MEATFTLLLSQYDGLVLGGNDFLYTKDMDCHPMAFFVYEYGRLLQSCGVDTIYLENHYITEPIQTRGLIASVMYCAFLYNFRVIGMEGKFTPELYKKYTGHTIEDTWTTVAYSTVRRLNRLNIIAKDIVDYSKKGKYVLFCGMSHVNDETDVTDCAGIKTLLGVPGVGCVFSDRSMITMGKPFEDKDSGYKRQVDYLLELQSSSVSKDRFYITTFIWSMVHDYLFLYKTIYNICKRYAIPMSVKLLWNHTTTIYPPIYLSYIHHMISLDTRLRLPKKELDDVCSYIHSLVQLTKEIPSRKQIVEALKSLTTRDLDAIVYEWLVWLKKLLHKKNLTNHKEALDTLSDIIFLEYKNLSTDKNEENYITYLTGKYRKQLDRPEHKLYRMLCIMKCLSIPYPTSDLIERLL